MGTHVRWPKRISHQLAVFLMMTICAVNVAAQDQADSGEWEKYVEVYGWLPNIYITTGSQNHLTITVSDLLRDLKWTTMLDIGARKDRWSFGVDSVYLHIATEEKDLGDFLGHPITDKLKIDMRAFFSTANVGYQIAGGEGHQLSVIGGVRYLYIRLPVEFDIEDTPDPGIDAVGSGHNWSGIVGLEGKKILNDRWYMDYYADIGTGDVDLTYKLKLGGGYNFKKFTGTFGVRYLRWNWPDDEDLYNLRVFGPYIGAKWTW